MRKWDKSTKPSENQSESKRRSSWIRFSTLLLLISIGLSAWPTGAQTESPHYHQSGLFSPIPESAAHHTDQLRQIRTNEGALRSRYVTLNQRLMQRSRSNRPLQLNLFDDLTLTFVPTHIESSDLNRGSESWIGFAAGLPHSEIILSTMNTANGPITVGTIQTGQTLYRIRYAGQALSKTGEEVAGVHIIEEMPAQLLPHGEPLEPDLLDEVQEVANPNTGREITSRQDRAEDQIDIDVLFLYTAAAESAFGGPEGTQNTINLSVTESNLGFRNSAIPVRLDIAHTHKVDIDEDQYSFSQLLSGITDTEDGMADEIHQLRDLYGADVVMLLVDRPLLCGISYQMKSLSLGNSRYAFNVVHQSCATGYYSVAHEIGHNLGSQHDRAHTSSSGIYPYSHGFQDPLNRFRTIMAYNCPVTCTRINHWSNPNVYFEGEAITGVAAGHPYAADNHLSIKETARVVSNYRTQVIEQKETLIINFQESELDGVANSVQDDGGIFKTHMSGYTYGWNQIYANGASHEDPDGGSVYVPVFGNGAPPLPEWQIALPDGRYQLSIAFGPEVDPATIADPELSFYVEDQLWEAWPAADPKPYSILEGGISLNDGRLSIRQDAGELILHHVTITRIDTETLLSLPVDPDFVQSPNTKKVYLPLVQMTNDE